MWPVFRFTLPFPLNTRDVFPRMSVTHTCALPSVMMDDGRWTEAVWGHAPCSVQFRPHGARHVVIHSTGTCVIAPVSGRTVLEYRIGDRETSRSNLQSALLLPAPHDLHYSELGNE